MLSAKDLLQELVRIPSINPAFSMGQGSEQGENRFTDFLQKFFEKSGLMWLRQEVHLGRDNIVAVCRTSQAASQNPPVLWEVHQDTVGVEGMTIDPFSAREAQGRIWGRGACDVKGGMAAMLTALSRIVEREAVLPQPLIVAFSINEECGFTGIKALCRLWASENDPLVGPENFRGPLSRDELRSMRPQRALVAEPTSLDVVVAHKGSVRWRCHTRGKAAHTSQPEQGRNAISAMVRVVQAIEEFQVEVLDNRPTHTLCGRPTVCVSTIQGGTGVNTVPDHAIIDIDRRLVPGETPEDAYCELVEFVAARTQQSECTIEHEPTTTQSSGLGDTSNRPWAEQIAATAGSLGQTSQLVGVPYGTDAWALAALGIPTVVFGPGSIDQAHTDDEWIDIDQLDRAAEIYYRLAVGG